MQSNEILAVVESVSKEKGLVNGDILNVIEVAIASTSNRHIQEEYESFVVHNREKGV